MFTKRFFGLAMTAMMIAGSVGVTMADTILLNDDTAGYTAAAETLAENGVATGAAAALQSGSIMSETVKSALAEGGEDRLPLSELTAMSLKMEGEELQKRMEQEAIEALLAEYDAVIVRCNDALNLRAEPVDGTVLRMIRAGKIAQLLDVTEEGWYKVTYGTTTGYVCADYCQAVHYAEYENTEATNTLRDDIIDYAFDWLGVRYVYGGYSFSGTDCSGFTMSVFGHFGIPLSHGAAYQYRNNMHVTTAEREAGDLVFFSSSSSSGVEHVGIYIGGGQFIHASTSRGVIISSLSESYYARHYLGAARVILE